MLRIRRFQSRREFQSTPPARGATSLATSLCKNAVISIHAPREGGDVQHRLHIDVVQFISIHAPREGGDFSARSYGLSY